MKKPTTHTWAAALSAVALTTLVLPTVASAGSRNGGFMSNVAIDERGAGRDRAGRGGADDPIGHNANDNRGRGRAGADDRIGHNANDDRGVTRTGANERPGHDVGDDNNRNQRGGK
jgi:hypothetical protein